MDFIVILGVVATFAAAFFAWRQNQRPPPLPPTKQKMDNSEHSSQNAIKPGVEQSMNNVKHGKQDA